MEPQVPTDEPMADVFAFCNQLAWRVGGPVLMYGSAWSVVAYSTLNQGLDDIRRSIILRRVIPPDPSISAVRQSAEEHFEAGTSCFEIPDMPGIQTRRVIAPIRLLGVDRRPLCPHRSVTWVHGIGAWWRGRHRR